MRSEIQISRPSREGLVQVNGFAISRMAKEHIELLEISIEKLIDERKQFLSERQRKIKEREEKIAEIQNNMFGYAEKNAQIDFDSVVDFYLSYSTEKYLLLGIIPFSTKKIVIDHAAVKDELLKRNEEFWKPIAFDIEHYINLSLAPNNGNVKPDYESFKKFLEKRGQSLNRLSLSWRYPTRLMEPDLYFPKQQELAKATRQFDIMQKYKNVFEKNIFMPIYEYNEFMNTVEEFKNV